MMMKDDVIVGLPLRTSLFGSVRRPTSPLEKYSPALTALLSGIVYKRSSE